MMMMKGVSYISYKGLVMDMKRIDWMSIDFSAAFPCLSWLSTHDYS